ncbi:MAG: hypothetical protein KBC12_02480 [Candidatus Pacebacteria bacterium]|nr:hypothetical protein [Candidatus Paceibacterota bacterium]
MGTFGNFFENVTDKMIGTEPKVNTAEEAISAIFKRFKEGFPSGGLWYNKKYYITWGFTKGEFTYKPTSIGLKENELTAIAEVFNEVKSKLKEESNLEDLSRAPYEAHPTDAYITEEKKFNEDAHEWNTQYLINGDDKAPSFHVLSLARKYVLENMDSLEKSTQETTQQAGSVEEEEEINGPLSSPRGFDRRYTDLGPGTE